MSNNSVSKEKDNEIILVSSGSSSTVSSDNSSDNSSNNSSDISTEISTDLSSDDSSISVSTDASDNIDTEDELSLGQLNTKQINDKFIDLESSIIMLKHNNQKRFQKLETDLTVCRKNIGDMSRRIFDLEDENSNIKISNIDILQKLEEQQKLNDDLIKKIIEMKEEKPKTLHFISRRNELF
jgi:hypothetical protein